MVSAFFEREKISEKNRQNVYCDKNNCRSEKIIAEILKAADISGPGFSLENMFTN